MNIELKFYSKAFLQNLYTIFPSLGGALFF